MIFEKINFLSIFVESELRKIRKIEGHFLRNFQKNKQRSSDPRSQKVQNDLYFEQEEDEEEDEEEEDK